MNLDAIAIGYQPPEDVKLLGWGDVEEARRLIEEAIDRAKIRG
jgi:inorganic pyrophosphatase